jgi:hypothetical protein
MEGRRLVKTFFVVERHIHGVSGSSLVDRVSFVGIGVRIRRSMMLLFLALAMGMQRAGEPA